MTSEIVSQVAHGTLTLHADGGFTYSPTAGYSGVDGFVYRASNLNGPGNDASVSLTVVAAPPTAVEDSFSVSANGSVTVTGPGVLGNDNTHGGGPMTAALATGTRHGALTLNADGGFAYRPELNFVGEDSFSYRAANIRGSSEVAAVIISVVGPTSPQPAESLVAHSVVGNVVTFRWTPPALGPAPTGYVLEGGILPTQVLASIPTGGTTPVFTIAVPTGSFLVRVHTLAGANRSGPSNEIQIHVDVPVAPSMPTHLLGLVNGSSLSLAWKNTFGGGAPSNLILDVTGSVSLSVPLGLADRFDFAAVPSGTYTFSVRAANSAGVSPPSHPVTLTFPGACSGAPLAPAHFLTYLSGRTIFALWDPQASGPAPTAFVVHVTGSFVGNIPTTSRSLSGAVAPGSYTVSVAATNPCGSSPATSTQTIIVP
jgi:hypothetical protein